MSAPPADVVDRLERLAAQAPRGSVDPEALWRRGKRRQRRRTAAALAAVAVVGVLGAGVAPLLVERSQEIQPADPDSAMVLPDVLRQPGGWDRTFGEAPGRLSAVGLGEAFSFRRMSSTGAWWGVSATTGESGFLDLPDLADVVDTPALSADGRLLAYWSTGALPGVPIVAGQKLDEGEDAAPAVGVTVLDLETGERQVWEVESEHGLYTGGLAWAGDVLWWSAGPVSQDETGAIGAVLRTRTWDVGSGERDESTSALRRRLSMTETVADPLGFVETGRALRLRRVVEDAEPTTLQVVLPDGTPTAAGLLDPAMSTDGSRVAALLMPDASRYDTTPKSLLAGTVDGRDVRLRPVDGVEEQQVVGWRSATEVVVLSTVDAGDGRAPAALTAWTVDVTTGERTRLVDFDVHNTPEVAADAWSAEVVPAPGTPLDTIETVAASAAAVVGLVLLAGWGTRRRRGHA